jgi:hypothetical protein
VQLAASNANAIAAPHILAAATVVPAPVITLYFLINKLDLLGSFGYDDWVATLFDPSAHANAAAFK